MISVEKSWIYNETAEFVRCAEELELSDMVRDSLRSWAPTVGRVQTNKTKRVFCSPKNNFEIWVARIPDPDSNRGSSGGFRLVYFFNLREQSIFLDKIERRANMGFKDEKPREKHKFDAYIESLKTYLLKELETEPEPELTNQP